MMDSEADLLRMFTWRQYQAGEVVEVSRSATYLSRMLFLEAGYAYRRTALNNISTRLLVGHV